MILSHKYRIIFVHIQKTGGNSITSLVQKLDPDCWAYLALPEELHRTKHCFATDIKRQIEPRVFDRYLKFCTVRNPYDRMISLYLKLTNNRRKGNDVKQAVTSRVRSFEEFLALPRNHPCGLFERFYVDQLEYMMNPDGTMLVDEVLRFENLERDFTRLAERVGLPTRLPHLNKSRRRTDYRRYYNPNLRDIIRRRFDRDFDRFGYGF